MLSAWSSIQVQCNVFEGADGEVALTAAGGLRQLPGLSETFENAALVLVYNVDTVSVSSLVYDSRKKIYGIWLEDAFFSVN